MPDSEPSDIQIDSVGRTACPRCHKPVDVSGVVALTMVGCESCGASFAAPGKVGEIILLKVLTRSPTGITYKGFEVPLRRHVAVKVMRRDFSADRELAIALGAETRVLAALTHPNVARTFSIGIEKGHPYIVMELVEGVRLAAILWDGKVLSEARSLRIGIGVAEALRAADRAKLVHGEVRPGSIIIRKDGQPKLLDFGVSQLIGGAAGDDGNLVVPHYASPEQSRGEAIDLRSDIYSLGATLYHCLASRPPFAGQTGADVLRARRRGPATDLREIRSSLRPETAAVVAKMLRDSPAQRHDEYTSLLADLNRALDASRKPPPKPARRRDRRTQALAALIDVAAPGATVDDQTHPAAIILQTDALQAAAMAIVPRKDLATAAPSRKMALLLLVAVLAAIAVGGVIGMWYLMATEFGDGGAADKARIASLEHQWSRSPDASAGPVNPPTSEFVGRIGVGTCETRAEFKDIRVVRAGRELFASHFQSGASGWQARDGKWQVVDGAYRQSGPHPDATAVAGSAKWADYTLTLKARKISGKEGFLILFRVKDPRDHYSWNIGGWKNTAYGIERWEQDRVVVIGKKVPGSVRVSWWYDIRVELSGPRVRCFLDGRLVHDMTVK